MDSPRQSLADRVTGTLREMSVATSQREMLTTVEALVERYPTSVLLNAMLRMLPEADSQLQGGLGLLAQRLPRTITEEKLLQQVLHKDLSTQTRFSAITILQDFLHRPVDPRFVQDISDVDSVILSSLRDAFAARSRFPGVLIEYTEQFARLEFQHRKYVLDLLNHVSVDDAVDLLQTMAYCANPEVSLQALDSLASLEAEDGERTLYILSQSLYLSSELAAAARQRLRQKRIAGGRFVPLTLPHSSLARFLGFDQTGVAHWYLAQDGRSYGLSVGFGFRQGVQYVRKVPHSSELEGWQQPSHIRPECRYEWARWLLSYTLSHFPPVTKTDTYPETYQILASELWQWAPPSEGAEALQMMCRAYPLKLEDREPASIAKEVSRLTYSSALRDLYWKKPQMPPEERISLCVWFLNVCALTLWHSQRKLAALLANSARLLEQDSLRATELLGSLQDLWTKAPE